MDSSKPQSVMPGNTKGAKKPIFSGFQNQGGKAPGGAPAGGSPAMMSGKGPAVQSTLMSAAFNRKGPPPGAV